MVHKFFVQNGLNGKFKPIFVILHKTMLFKFFGMIMPVKAMFSDDKFFGDIDVGEFSQIFPQHISVPTVREILTIALECVIM